jgi:hypothetical protein
LKFEDNSILVGVGDAQQHISIFSIAGLVRWPHTSRGKDWPSKKQGAHGEGPRAPREKKTLELANDGLGKSETGVTNFGNLPLQI